MRSATQHSTPPHRKPDLPHCFRGSRRYGRRLVISDCAGEVLERLGGQFARFGTDSTAIVIWRESSVTTPGGHPSQLQVADRNDRAGRDLVLLIAIVAFMLEIDLTRSCVSLVFPIGVLALAGYRWLISQRERGRFSLRVVLIGSMSSVAGIDADLNHFSGAGYKVAAAFSPGHGESRGLPGRNLSLTHNLGDAIGRMGETRADSLMLTRSDRLPLRKVRDLIWSREPSRHGLTVAPSVTDLGGPLIRMRLLVGASGEPRNGGAARTRGRDVRAALA